MRVAVTAAIQSLEPRSPSRSVFAFLLVWVLHEIWLSFAASSTALPFRSFCASELEGFTRQRFPVELVGFVGFGDFRAACVRVCAFSDFGFVAFPEFKTAFRRKRAARNGEQRADRDEAQACDPHVFHVAHLVPLSL